MGRYSHSGLGAGTTGNPQGNLGQTEYGSTVDDSVNHLPPNDSQLKHIFRNARGHLPDSPENRRMVETVANSPEYYYGVDGRGLKSNWTARKFGCLYVTE